MTDPPLQVDPSAVAMNTDDPSIDSSQQTSKRKLDEEPDHSVELPPAKTQETYVKHPNHWALDGNVLLQLGYTRFSVHRSRLATQSSWFEKLFSVRSGLPLDVNDIDTEEIEYIVEHFEVVDGIDLFYLHYYKNTPNTEEFSTLLTAMDDAIEYVHNKPAFNMVKNILIAAQFYRFDKFFKFAKAHMLAFFPRNVKDITSAEIPNCVDAIKLARKCGIHKIMPAAFYQLARMKPSATSHELEKLTPQDFIILSDLQKLTVVLWDDIAEIIGHDCSADCMILQAKRMRAIKIGRALHPIMGISFGIGADWRVAKDCPVSMNEVSKKLAAARSNFWADMKERLRCNCKIKQIE